MTDSNISRLVIDAIKPHNPPMHLLSTALVRSPNSGIEGVNITLIEYDRQTQTIKIMMQGKNLDYDIIAQKLEEFSCSIRSVDQVVCGTIVEFVKTPQD